LRAALAVLLTMVLVPAIGPELASPTDLASLGKAALAEGAVGAALGFSAALIVAAARQGGEIVGAQAGLSAAGLLDPDLEAVGELNPIGHLYGLVALGTFLALDGPLALVRSLMMSYQLVPAGGASLSAASATQLFGQVAGALELALHLAAPTALALVVAGFALGLLARHAPASTALGLAWPLRSTLGLVLALLGLAALVAALTATWQDWLLNGPDLPL
jgi:flagellar biosynthesis protein FliR